MAAAVTDKNTLIRYVIIRTDYFGENCTMSTLLASLEAAERVTHKSELNNGST